MQINTGLIWLICTRVSVKENDGISIDPIDPIFSIDERDDCLCVNQHMRRKSKYVPLGRIMSNHDEIVICCKQAC